MLPASQLHDADAVFMKLSLQKLVVRYNRRFVFKRSVEDLVIDGRSIRGFDDLASL
jgi:transcription initiation factor TFIIIB Brf1 subunit/transcription initiation factor TFIIB